jgi:hypothetical protein
VTCTCNLYDKTFESKSRLAEDRTVEEVGRNTETAPGSALRDV